MTRTALRRTVAGVALAATAVWGVPGASAEPPEGVDFAAEMSQEAAEFTWTGTTTAGVNVTHFDAALGEECGDTPDTQCDRVLFTVDLPLPEGARSQSGTLTVTIGDYTVPVSDFDAFAYSSDETGARGDRLSSSGNNPGDPETVAASLLSTPTKQVHHVLVEIPYFAAAGAYEGTATFKPGRTRS